MLDLIDFIAKLYPIMLHYGKHSALRYLLYQNEYDILKRLEKAYGYDAYVNALDDFLYDTELFYYVMLKVEDKN